MARQSLLIVLAAVLVLAAVARAETRLPANRVYLAFVQGLFFNPFAGEFVCLRVTQAGELLGSEDRGEWSIDDELSVSRHQRAIRFRFTIIDDEIDPPEEGLLEGLCWLDDLGARNTLACAAHGVTASRMMNFGLVGRPLGGGATAATMARCQDRAQSLNEALGLE